MSFHFCWFVATLVSCLASTTSSKDMGDIQNLVYVSKFEISGEDLVNDFVRQNRSLVIRAGCKNWPIYDVMMDSDQEKLKDLPLQVSMVHHTAYNTESSTLGYFMNTALYGSQFHLNSARESVKTLINVPWMITSCKPIFKSFLKTSRVDLRGSKTKLLSKLFTGCNSNDTIYGLLSGTAKLRFFGKKSSVRAFPGDLIYLPKGQCHHLSTNGTAIVVAIQWNNQVTDPSDCPRASVHDVTKDLPMSSDERDMVSNDHTLPDVILNTGYTIPAIGLGTARLFSKTYETVTKALDLGYRLIDTAQIYSGDEKIQGFRTSSEEEVGRALVDSQLPRSKLFLVTKLDPEFKSMKEAVKLVERSLERLQTDYIDLVLVHDFYGSKCKFEDKSSKCAGSPWQGWRALEKMMSRGVVRSIGVSNVAEQDLTTLIEKSKTPVSVVQNWFDPLHQDKKVREICEQHGIKYIGYSTLGFVWIDKMFGVGFSKNPVLTHRNIIDVGANSDLPLSSVVLRWAMLRNVIVIPCTTNPDHLEKNINVRYQFLPKENLQRVDIMDNELGNPDDPDWRPPTELQTENGRSGESISQKETKDEL